MADLTITAANVLKVGTLGIKTGIAGATITAGQAVYLDSATGTLKLAQCDGTAAEADVVGVALHGATANQPLTYAGDGATINIGGTTSKATTYMVSAAAGGVAPQADLVSTNRIAQIGYATDAVGGFTLQIRNRGITV